jgi:plastocyanin
MVKKGFKDRQARCLSPPTSSARIGAYPASPWFKVTSRWPSLTRCWPVNRGFDTRTLISHFRSATERLANGRAVIVAMLIGPVIGATLAVASVMAQDTANVVTIDNFTFTPRELMVAVGTTVKWVNHDDIPHLVVNKDKAFRSKALDTDDSFSYTFASAGTFDYFCGLHPYMVGKVIVK